MQSDEPTRTQPLEIGERAPHFSLPDAKGRLLSMESALSYGPLVLVFYRGDW